MKTSKLAFFLVLGLPLFAFGDPSRPLQVSVKSAAPGAKVTLSWALPEKPRDGEWIGLYLPGSKASGKDSSKPLERWVPSGKKGQLVVQMPETRGQYEFRWFLDPEFTEGGRTPAIDVTGIDVTPPAVALSGTLALAWPVVEGDGTGDWVGLFPVGTRDESAPLWKGAVGGGTSASVKAPAEPGRYELRYFRGGAELKNMRSVPIPVISCFAKPSPASRIQHLVVVIQENHSFDSYFGLYCKAPTGSDPTCEKGRQCCEAAPSKDPGTGTPYTKLSEVEHMRHDPNHQHDCNVQQMNGGKMDRYVSAPCGGPGSFAYADGSTVGQYWDLARRYAMGDRVFHSIAGASASNNMYFAQARYVFRDNDFYPPAIGSNCVPAPERQYNEATVGDLLNACGVSWSFYAGGYRKAVEGAPQCIGNWPQFYDPGDVPFAYYRSSVDNPKVMKDYEDFKKALDQGTLPSVSYVKALGTQTEHPGSGITMEDGQKFVAGLLASIQKSPKYRHSALVILTPDEGGGYFDHVAPPPPSAVDGQQYGARVYFMTLGHFSKTNHISHVPMEHSSIVRFIEWNWLAGQPGQLGWRDAVVNNIGSLLDPAKTGKPVPERQ